MLSSRERKLERCYSHRKKTLRFSTQFPKISISFHFSMAEFYPKEWCSIASLFKATLNDNKWNMIDDMNGWFEFDEKMFDSYNSVSHLSEAIPLSVLSE